MIRLPKNSQGIEVRTSPSVYINGTAVKEGACNCIYAHVGYIPMRASKIKVSARLNRVEGQIRGIQKMVDEDRYCMDILIQLRAAKAALHQIETMVLRDHISGCVVEAFASGNAVERQEKIDELVETIGRMTR